MPRYSIHLTPLASFDVVPVLVLFVKIVFDIEKPSRDVAWGEGRPGTAVSQLSLQDRMKRGIRPSSAAVAHSAYSSALLPSLIAISVVCYCNDRSWVRQFAMHMQCGILATQLWPARSLVSRTKAAAQVAMHMQGGTLSASVMFSKIIDVQAADARTGPECHNLPCIYRMAH